MALIIKAGQFQEPSERTMTRQSTVLLPLEGRSGFVFALCSLKGRSGEIHAFANIIREHLERLSSSFGKEANVQHRFEQFLRALNEQVATSVKEGQLTLPIKSVSALVGIACDEQMFLSGTGDLTALFLHRKPTQQYQVFNLFRSIQTEQALPTWEKAFAVVLDGDLHAGDVLCVANNDLQRAVPADDLNAILATLPPSGASAKIRQYFPATTDLTMIIIQSQNAEAPAVEQAQPLTSVSVEKFEETQAETQRFLEDQRPKLLPMLMGFFQKKKQPHARPTTAVSRFARVMYWMRSVGLLTTSSLRVAAGILTGLFRGMARSSAVLAKKEARQEKIQETKQKTDRAITSALQRFNKLPSSSKYLALAAVAVIFVFVTSISFLSQARARSEAQQAYQDQIVMIEDKQAEADAARIYKNERQARTLYLEALTLINDLPTDTQDQQQKADELRSAIQVSLDELRHVVNIPEPTLVADLNTSAADVVGRALFQTSEGIHLLASDKNVYKVNTTDRTATRVEAAAGEVGVAQEATMEDDRVYFLDDRPGISRFDVANDALQVTNISPPENTRWIDLVGYSDRLYVLEPAGGGSEGQVVRFSRAGAGFDGGTDWIKSKSTDLSDAVSIAIDATVFVLKQNGEIVRFTSGSEVGWDAALVDPPITQATDIWTDTASSFVYVLEPSAQRLIIYNKEDGSFVLQYRSDAFSGMTDMLIDEVNKTIYLLAGSKLYSIRASHLP